MRYTYALLTGTVLTGVLVALLGSVETGDHLVVYSGRNRSLVEPLIDQFQAETGIRVKVKYGTTPQLVMTLREEGRHSPADVFWAQETMALDALNESGLLEQFPSAIIEQSAPSGRLDSRHWVATSGRARVLAFNAQRVQPEELPDDVLGLMDAKWGQRIGWAPSNGSFQAFLTGMRQIYGEEVSRDWIQGLRANGVKAYPNNTAILQALGAGEIDLGLTNHYYLLRFLEDDPDFPVSQTAFRDGDPGNFVNYAGIGILRTASNKEAAQRFVRFLLNEGAQHYFCHEVYEYPVNDSASRHEVLASLDGLLQRSPEINQAAMADLEGTLNLLRDEGVL